MCPIMSSEESGTDDGDEVLFVRPLPLRSAKVDTFFSTSDRTSKENKSPQALREIKRRVLASDSAREKPAGNGLPKWAFESTHDF